MHGIPTVLAGTIEDKAETVMRALWARTSVRFKKARPSVEELRWVIDAVLEDDNTLTIFPNIPPIHKNTH
ncbi:hypothetical protein LZ30DRAFT_784919 [Colletotrichum cereale]|nr:hypothetical protein LZ30DRAFT_784919 [Colletotrichum cereale]